MYSNNLINVKNNQDMNVLKLDLNEKSNFIKPHYIFDTLNKSLKEPIIKETTDITFLEQFKISVFSCKIESEEAWAPRQRNKYYLRKQDLPRDEDSQELSKLPSHHFLQIDIANRRLRLCGPYILPNQNYTEWIYY